MIGELRRGDGDRGEPCLPVDQVLIDLVGDHPQAAAGCPASDLGDQLWRVDRAGRVRGGDEDQQLGPVGAVRLQRRDRGQEARVLVGQHGHGNGAGEPDHLGVSGPVRRRQQHLVARVEQGREGLEDGLLATVGDQDLARLDRQS